VGNKLNIQKTEFDGLYVIEPIVHEDDRGSFSRVFCEDELSDIFQEKNIKQVNHSVTTKKGTVRGMHFQYAPNCEVKILKCIKGKVFDVVVDIRKESKTFLQTFCIELSEDNRKMIYIPEGFAHGFQTLENSTELLYFHNNIYTPNNEGALNVKDPLLNIKWPLDIIKLSIRDEEHNFIDNNFKGVSVEL
jgi:dTDP-4-dehydrorhamnose 3,5-epimerase